MTILMQKDVNKVYIGLLELFNVAQSGSCVVLTGNASLYGEITIDKVVHKDARGGKVNRIFFVNDNAVNAGLIIREIVSVDGVAAFTFNGTRTYYRRNGDKAGGRRLPVHRDAEKPGSCRPWLNLPPHRRKFRVDSVLREDHGTAATGWLPLA